MDPHASSTGESSSFGTEETPGQRAVRWTLRLLVLTSLAAAAGLAMHRFRRSPEQKELAHYVEVELPALQRLEAPILFNIEKLAKAPGLKPPEARILIIDELIPQLLRLRKNAEALPLSTDEVRGLHAQYLRVVDQLIEACRTCLRVIDDPSVSTTQGYGRVMEQFAAAQTARRSWQTNVAASCRRHRLLGAESRS